MDQVPVHSGWVMSSRARSSGRCPCGPVPVPLPTGPTFQLSSKPLSFVTSSSWSPRAQCSLVRTRGSDAHLPLGLSVIHLAHWCPSRSFTYYPLVSDLAAGWHPPQKELLSRALPSLPALSPFPPTCGSQAVPSARGSAQDAELPNSPDVGAFPEAICSSAQAPASLQTPPVHTTLSLRVGVGEQVCESPRFPLCPRCWLQALRQAATELQATAQVAVTLSSLCLGLSQLFPSWARLRGRRDERQEENARGTGVLLGPQASLRPIPPTLWLFA